nr:RNA-directed DNA polymerase, eukaryota [Tanacetum cinerariifolium]
VSDLEASVSDEEIRKAVWGCRENKSRGLRIDDALTISHLFYADDAIFIGEWSKENLKGGIEEQQLEHLVDLLDSVILSNLNDKWVSDLNGDGVFRVKDVRNLLDEFFLPRADVPTRDVTRLLCRWWNLGVQTFHRTQNGSFGSIRFVLLLI